MCTGSVTSALLCSMPSRAAFPRRGHLVSAVLSFSHALKGQADCSRDEAPLSIVSHCPGDCERLARASAAIGKYGAVDAVKGGQNHIPCHRIKHLSNKQRALDAGTPSGAPSCCD